MQPQVASEKDKMVPIDTSGDPVDVELKDDEKKDDVKVEEQTEETKVEEENFENKKEVENIQNDLKNSGVKVGPLHEHRDGTASFYMKDTEGNWLEMLYVPPEGIQSNV